MASGWFYSSVNQQNKKYGSAFTTNDVISVEVDYINGTISMTKNGEDFGIAFSGDLTDKELYPAVSFCAPGEKATFRGYTSNSGGALVAGAGKIVVGGLEVPMDSPIRYHRYYLVLEF